MQHVMTILYILLCLFRRTQDLLHDTRSSRVGCASNCHISPVCRSYFYNKGLHRCRTHSITFGVDDPGAIHELGWEYYGRRVSSIKRKKAREKASQTRTHITTMAPGMGGGLKFALNVTTPIPKGDDMDDVTDDDEDDDDTIMHTTQGAPIPATSEKDSGNTGNVGIHTSSSSVTRSTVHMTSTQSDREATMTSHFDTVNSSPQNSPDFVTTRVTDTGSKVTIRKTTVSAQTKVSTSVPDSTISGGTTKTTTGKQRLGEPTDSSTVKSGQTNGRASDISRYATTSRKGDISASNLPHDSTQPHRITDPKQATQSHSTTAHDEDTHDHLNFLTTESDIAEMSTGLVLSDMTASNKEESSDSVTIVLMVSDDDEDQTHKFIMDTKPDTTISVLSLGRHTHVHDTKDDDDNDDDNGDRFFTIFPSTTDLLGFLNSGTSKDKIEEKNNEIRDVPYTVVKENDAIGATKSTDHGTRSTSGSYGSVTANVAAVVTIGLAVPVAGIGAYVLYRKRKTGSWNLLKRQDDGLGLQLIKTT